MIRTPALPFYYLEYRNLCQVLLKYFIRISSRPTPYGCFANVSIGEFGLNTNIEKEDEIIDIKVDTDCANGLIKNLENITEMSDITNSLNKLKYLFDEYKKNQKLRILKKIYDLMKSLNESSNYIELNTGCKYSSKTLNKELKNKIENFVNKFSKISPEINNYGFLSNFKNKFIEKYGSNIEVDLIEIIDENKFNGFIYLNDSYNPSDREKEFSKNKKSN